MAGAQAPAERRTEMNKRIEQVYEREQAIRKAYEEAKAAKDQAGIEVARADYQQMEATVFATEDAGFGFVYRLYKQMKERGNQYIDISIPMYDAVGALNDLRKYGVEKFTFSSGWSSAVETAWVFQKNGCRLEGLIELNGIDNDWFGTGEREKVHGYLFSIQ